MNCIGYKRVSTLAQADERLTSLDDQETACVQLAARLGLTVGQWFVDTSSGTSAEGRPAFLGMLAWCERNRQPAKSPGIVVCLNDSRFGRFDDSEESTFHRFALKKLGWIVRFAENDDVDGEMRPFMRALGQGEASKYSKTLSANTRRGMRGQGEMGFWTRPEPFGFRRKIEGTDRVLEPGELKAKNQSVRLFPYEAEAALVRWAFEAYAAGGASLHSLVGVLMRKAPGRRWSRTVVNHMLRNEAYRGAVVGGRRRKDGTGPVYRCEHAHPAIVTDALFSAVQARLDENAKLGKGTVHTSYLLSGLLTCPYCAYPFTGGGGGKSRTQNSSRAHRRFYKDNGGIAGVCFGALGTVSRHIVDDAALELIGDTVASLPFRRAMAKELDVMLADAADTGAAETKLRAQRTKLDQKLARVVGLLADGTLLREEGAATLERIRREIAEVDGRAQELRFSRSRLRDFEAVRESTLELAQAFPVAATRLSGAALRELVKPWIGYVTFDKVTRDLGLGIPPLPATPSLGLFLSCPRPPAGQKQAGLIVRNVSLLRQGFRGQHLRHYAGLK